MTLDQLLEPAKCGRHARPPRLERTRSSAARSRPSACARRSPARLRHRAVAGAGRTSRPRRRRAAHARTPCRRLRPREAHSSERWVSSFAPWLLTRHSARCWPGAESVADVPVTGVVYDSRQAAPGSVFVSIRGLQADGASLRRGAVARGAVAVVAEDRRARRGQGAVVPGRRRAARAGGALAVNSIGRPSERITLVGITGTNGKTTTSYLLAAIFEAAGITLRPHRHRRLPHRRPRGRSGADDPGGAGAAAHAPRHGRAGLRRLRDGSVVARAGAAARRPPALRRR